MRLTILINLIPNNITSRLYNNLTFNLINFNPKITPPRMKNFIITFSLKNSFTIIKLNNRT